MRYMYALAGSGPFVEASSSYRTRYHKTVLSMDRGKCAREYQNFSSVADALQMWLHQAATTATC